MRESINTLRYATKAKKIETNPQSIERNSQNGLIQKLKEEICTLRYLLASFSTGKNNGTPVASLHALPHNIEVHS